jgi:hypothetical protein
MLVSPDFLNSPGDRLKPYNSERLTPKGRDEVVRVVVDGAPARHFDIASKTVAMRVARY